MILNADSSRSFPIADRSVDCIVTSPPYWRLRDYGVAGQLGLEAMPEEYVARLLEVFRECRRVLKPTGSLWLNLGDSRIQNASFPPLKRLDMAGLPATVAAALREDGWYLRAEVIWRKPNPVPETIYGWAWEPCRRRVRRQKARARVVPRTWETRQGADHASLKGNHKDPEEAVWEPCPGCKHCEGNDGLRLRKGAWRPTTAHEMVFLLTPTATYYGDQVAASEPCSGTAKPRGRGVNPRAEAADHGVRANAAFSVAVINRVSRRNPRTVWEIYPDFQASRSGHFASFPVELAWRCIEASTSERGNCGECGMPWARVVERHRYVDGKRPADSPYRKESRLQLGRHGRMGNGRVHTSWSTKDWKACCTCGADPVPAIVFDPFAGTSTTGVAAHSLGRKFIGLELSKAYCSVSRERLNPAQLSIPPTTRKESKWKRRTAI